MAAFFTFFAVDAFGAEDINQPLVSPELLGHAKLKTLWENKLPIREGESLEQLLIVGNRIYALSSQNYMMAMDIKEGKMLFGRNIASAGLPVVGLELYDGKLMSEVAGRLVEMNPDTGEGLSSYYPGFGIVCPAARNSSYLYLAGADKCLHTYRFDDKIHVFDVGAKNESPITSVLADEDEVIFATDAGNLISARADKPVKLWQFDAAGGIIGPLIRDGSSLYFACKDTCVYRVDMAHEGAELVWKHQTNALLDKAPYITPGVVYQRAGGKGIAAVDKKSGKLLWQLAEGADLLAEDKAKAYLISKVNTLTVMDNATGKKLYSVNFAQVTRYAVNTQDGKMFIADKDGRIACLESVEQGQQ